MHLLTIIVLLLLLQTIKSKNAWQSPENATDFPRCHFEIIHVDKTKQSFFCGMTASHENDQANTEVVAYFERVSYNDHKGLLI